MEEKGRALSFERWFAGLTLVGFCPKTGIFSTLTGRRGGVNSYRLERGGQVIERAIDLKFLRAVYRQSRNEAMLMVLTWGDEAAEALGYDIEAMETRLEQELRAG